MILSLPAGDWREPLDGPDGDSLRLPADPVRGHRPLLEDPHRDEHQGQEHQGVQVQELQDDLQQVLPRSGQAGEPRGLGPQVRTYDWVGTVWNGAAHVSSFADQIARLSFIRPRLFNELSQSDMKSDIDIGSDNVLPHYYRYYDWLYHIRKKYAMQTEVVRDARDLSQSSINRTCLIQGQPALLSLIAAISETEFLRFLCGAMQFNNNKSRLNGRHGFVFFILLAFSFLFSRKKTSEFCNGPTHSEWMHLMQRREINFSHARSRKGDVGNLTQLKQT